MLVLSPSSLTPLFQLPPSSPQIASFISTLSPSPIQPEIKSYPDAVYHNYYHLGISLCFLPNKGLESVDLFNRDPDPPRERAGRKAKRYEAAPELLVVFTSTEIPLPPRKEKVKEGMEQEVKTSIPRPPELRLTPITTGKDLVSCLGEPTRKGSGGWTGLWLEWSSVVFKSSGREEGKDCLGMMVELRDPGPGEVTEETLKKGLGSIWERGAKWEWKSLKMFKTE